MELIEIGKVLFWRDGVETNWPLFLDSGYVRKKKDGEMCVWPAGSRWLLRTSLWFSVPRSGTKCRTCF